MLRQVLALILAAGVVAALVAGFTTLHRAAPNAPLDLLDQLRTRIEDIAGEACPSPMRHTWHPAQHQWHAEIGAMGARCQRFRGLIGANMWSCIAHGYPLI